MATSMDILIFFALAIFAMAERSTPATPGDTFLVPQSRDEHAGVREIKLASAISSQPILLSRDGAYAWKFFQSYGNATQRLLVVLSTLFNTTVVWMANRDLPVSPQATLLVTPLPSPSLVLRDADGTVVWSPKVANISAIVMNSTGNLFILTGGASASENPKWQSFDEPSDVLLPGQYVKPAHTSTASLAWNDWRSGHYTLRADPGGAVLYATFDAQQTMIPYSVLNYIISNTSFTASLHSACNHTSILYNADATGVTLLQQGNISAECLQEDRNSVHGVKFSTRIAGDGFRYMRVMPTGDIDSFFLSNSTGLRVDNELFKGFYSTYCKLPSYCGVNGVCSSVQTCTCPELFQAMDPNDPTEGCRLQTPLNCTIFRQHKFVQISGAYYFANAYVPPRKIVDNPTECTDLCLENCSCTAAFYNNNTGSCHLYDQIRTVEFGTSPQVTAFLRVAALPSTTTYNGKHYQGRKVTLTSDCSIV
ncbi:hypothetical protein KP509_04G010800 [Ceratopteris richardii]|uniref:Uncharacterized protein n=1 Tax=Ceratopteris richardii TaxID=49495 RepID=A0A8T2USN8_CERRI|nr:hypothetical protein KP509_04G010800 [Ceratopteris richardii]